MATRSTTTTTFRAGARVFAVMSILWCALPVAAQAPQTDLASSSGDAPEYKRSVARAVEEFSAGNYPEARDLFARAHEIYPNARTLRGLGMVAFELRNYGVCVENLEASLASTERPLPERLRSETLDMLARAKAFVARINVKVSPKTARVWLDGVPVEVAEGQALVLEVGDHVFEVQATGFLSERRAVSITGGERLKLSVVMQQPQPGGTADSSRHDDAGPARRRWYKNPWVWTGVVVVAAGVGVGIALALRPGEKVEPMGPTRTPNTPTSGVFQSLGSW